MALPYRATYHISKLRKSSNDIGLKVQLWNDINFVSSIAKQGIGYHTTIFQNYSNYFSRNKNIYRSKLQIVQNLWRKDILIGLMWRKSRYITREKLFVFYCQCKMSLCRDKTFGMVVLLTSSLMVNISSPDYEIKSYTYA